MAGVVLLYFRHGSKDAIAPLSPNGDLGLGSLAAELGLDPVGVKAGPIVLNFDSSTGQSPAFADLLHHVRQLTGDALLGSSQERPITLQGRTAAAPTPAGATNTGGSSGKVTSASLLASCLPSLQWLAQDKPSSTAGGKKYYLPPDGVALLDKDPRSEAPWAQEVMKLQQDAGSLEHWAQPLRQERLTPAAAEADIGHAFVEPLEVLLSIQRKSQTAGGLPQVQGWVPELGSTILHNATTCYAQSYPIETMRLSQLHSGISATSSSSNTSNRGYDFLLMVETEQESPTQQSEQHPPLAHQQPFTPEQQLLMEPPVQHQPPATRQGELGVKQLWRPVAVGELKSPPFLTSRAADRPSKPADLIDGYHNKDAKALHVIGQVFTYLLLSELRYGFISCYFWTWAVHLSVDRRVLYISAPISHTTASSEIAPAVTAMGAIYWTQVNGLRTYKDKVAGLPDGLQTVQEYVDALAVDLPSQPSQATLDTSDDDPDYDPSKPEVEPSLWDSHRSSRDSGSKSRSKSGTHTGLAKSGVSKVVGNKRQLAAEATAQLLLLGDVICRGCSGPVLYGTYNGQPAVVKLFGPDKDGLAAGRNEIQIYRELGDVQGIAVPKFLAWGHLAAGIYYMVTARVNGVPYSQLSSVQQPAAVAAERALQQICSIQPGFVHADLRLANIMLQHSDNDTAQPAAMIIDFAASRLDAAPVEVKAEFRRLRFLLLQ